MSIATNYVKAFLNGMRVWRVQPVKFGRKMVRALVRIGYSPRPAARGVVAWPDRMATDRIRNARPIRAVHE